jgi:hypothetical protein
VILHDAPYTTLATLFLSHLLSIHIDADARRRLAGRKPALGVFVEKGPRWHNGDKGKGGASEANVERHTNVLCHVAHEEGDDLPW